MAGNPGAPFNVPVAAHDLGANAFEVLAGGGIQAPSDITATLSATNGDITVAQAVIRGGANASEVITVVHSNDAPATVTVDNVSFEASRYTGVSFVAGDPASIVKDGTPIGICSRTRAVQDILIDMVGANYGCIDLNNDRLSHISRPFAIVETDLASLRPGDLAGLTNVKDLYIYGNQLTELPEGLLAGSGSFERVLLQDNPGSDFALTVNVVEKTDGTMKAVIREGSPFWTKVRLSADGGGVHPVQVNIYGGDTESDENITVQPDTPSGVVTVTVERAWFEDTGLTAYSYYDGFVLETGRHITGAEQTTVETTPTPEPTPAATSEPTPTTQPTPTPTPEPIPATPPSGPSNLTAQVSHGNVILSWDAPSTGEVTGYQILRRRPTMGEDTLRVYVSNTGNTDTTFTDTSVAVGIRHAYRVKAINSAGTGPQSNFVRATP